MTHTTTAGARRSHRAGGSAARRTAVVALAATATALGALALAPAALAAGGGPVPPEYAMEQVLPPKRCAKVAQDAGWKEHELVIATAIALAESGCDPKATGSNPPSESCPDGSLDRGAWQINSCWHPEVTDECAYKLKCNAEAAYDIYVESSHSFEPWTTWDIRSFRFWLTEARHGVKKVTGEKYVVGVVWTEGGALNIRKKPTSESDIVGTLADQSVIYIDCQKRGEEVYSPVFDYSTKWWDKLGDHQYVSNAYVDTDSTERVAHKC